LSKIKFIHQDCDPSMAEDTSLPYTCYLVEYYDDGKRKFDLVTCNKKVDIFDHYWDKYRDNFVTIKQSEGRINPKLWGNEPPKTKSRK
jgi:hypothetical protein